LTTPLPSSSDHVQWSQVNFKKESKINLANLGARYGSHLNQNQLAKFFGYFCLLIGLFVPLYRFFKKDERKNAEGKYFIHALSGCVIGFLSGLIVNSIHR
jgi:hypothetical protein